MPYFLLAQRLELNLLSEFTGEGDPAVLLEGVTAQEIIEKLGGSLVEKKSESCWMIELDPSTLTPLTEDTPGVKGYYKDLLSDEEDPAEHGVFMVGNTAFLFSPDEPLHLFLAQIPFSEI